MDKTKFGGKNYPARKSFRNNRMREEIAMEIANPRKYKELIKLRERKYAGPKEYRHALIETYRSSVEENERDE